MGGEGVKLYSYWRSSAAYRVRIALNLKGIDYEIAPVHLPGDEQHSEEFRAVNPQQLVPVLVDRSRVIRQSMAIIEYLDETVAEPPLLPADALGRARVRALSLDIACEIHPLDNLRVLRYLQSALKVSDNDKNRWYRHWVETGLEVVERQLAGHPQTGRFCHGDTPGMADCVLVPQIFNAQRMDCRLDHVPTVMRVFEACMAETAFASTQPSACPDAQ